jgi:nucleotide-binding universal stress UspA family protein
LTYIKWTDSQFGLACAENIAREATMANKEASVAERQPQTALAVTPASILVYIDFDVGCDKRIKFAADWAAKFNATLIGVAGWIPGRETGGWFATELERAEDRSDRILAEIAKLGESFRIRVGGAVQTLEWRGSFHFPREVIPAEARAVDLVVIGSRPVKEDVYRAFDPGTVLLNAGRPVLVVPDNATGTSGERVLVAWKDTREARHAVQGALPYLKAAKQVSLVAIAEGVLEWAARNQLDDVEKYLSRHGVKVREKCMLNPEGSASDQLISFAKGDGTDLIVAGAYGHSRLGEWVFGGVTRGLLERSDVCCLLCN